MRRIGSALLRGGAFAALAFAVASPASAECQLQKLAEIPVTMVGLKPTITTKVNGQDATFVVDSGAFFSMISTDAVARFGLKPTAAPFGLELRGIGGGQAAAKVAKAENFGFAGAVMHGTQFLVAERAGGQVSVGLLGQNVLGAFDTEYDLANGVIRFFIAKDCREANLAYWSAGKALSRVSIEDTGPKIVSQVKATAKIDGHAVHVLFDTGSPVSFLSKPAAGRAGIRPASEGVVAAGLSFGLFGKGIETFLAPFGSFAIGDEEIRNTRLRVADIDMGDSGDMLIGADFFLSHRILVSRSQHKLYFTYNGGPVFRLDRGAGAEPDQTAAAGPPSPPAGPSGPAASMGAADFSRRGAASMSRGDFNAAIADFTSAIALEPADGRAYHARAMARLGNHQAVLAMSDLDQALKHQPNDVEALMTRGQLYLAAHDEERARNDFDAAIKLAPENRMLRLNVAGAYMQSEHYEAAIREYDAWIAAHPKSDDYARAVAERCNVRATWGKQLEVGLADCDLALKLGGKVSTVMENRAFLLLRLGRAQEALTQFDAAIRLQPKSAWSLYGRGLAEIKTGAKPQGEADIAAAIAIRPGMVKEAVRYGLIPGEAPTPAGKL